MQQWSWLIVPIIMFVLFVVSQLMRREEEKQRQRRLSQPRREPQPPRPEDDRSEMQRFLDEVQRMRERSEQKKQEATAPWSPPVQQPEPVVPVVRVAPRPQPRRRAPTPPAQPQPVLEVLAVETESRVPTSKASVGAVRRRGASPAARQMLSLLQSPQSLATAWLLKEVFDRPLCMRERR